MSKLINFMSKLLSEELALLIDFIVSPHYSLKWVQILNNSSRNLTPRITQCVTLSGIYVKCASIFSRHELGMPVIFDDRDLIARSNGQDLVALIKYCCISSYD